MVQCGGTILRLLLLHFGLFLVVDVNFAPRDAKFYIHLHNSLWVRPPWLPLLSDVVVFVIIVASWLLVTKCHHLVSLTWGKGNIIPIVINEPQLCDCFY